MSKINTRRSARTWSGGCRSWTVGCNRGQFKIRAGNRGRGVTGSGPLFSSKIIFKSTVTKGIAVIGTASPVTGITWKRFILRLSHRPLATQFIIFPVLASSQIPSNYFLTPFPPPSIVIELFNCCHPLPTMAVSQPLTSNPESHL